MLVLFVTSFPAPYPGSMDKVDYEAKLASEVEKLHAFQKALAEEHTSIAHESEDGEPLLDAKTVYSAAEQKLLKAVSKAADTVVELLTYSDKDNVRFSVAKYIIDNAKMNPAVGQEDPFDEILRRIRKEPVADTE